MRKFVLLLLLLAGGGMLRTESREIRDAGESQQAGRALLKLDHTSHDFGEVPRKGGDIAHEFPFENDGDAPLVIIRAQTSLFLSEDQLSQTARRSGSLGNNPRRLRAPQERAGIVQQAGTDLLERRKRTGDPYRTGVLDRRGGPKGQDQARQDENKELTWQHSFPTPRCCR